MRNGSIALMGIIMVSVSTGLELSCTAWELGSVCRALRYHCYVNFPVTWEVMVLPQHLLCFPGSKHLDSIDIGSSGGSTDGVYIHTYRGSDGFRYARPGRQ